jgi:hypothetical protein
MSFVEGQALCRVWNDPEAMPEEKRLRVLSNLASLLAQLYQLPYPRIGMLHFDPDLTTDEPEVGASIERVQGYFEDGWGKIHLSGPFDSLNSYLMNTLDMITWPSDRAMSDDALLRLAIESIPSFLTSEGRYTLSLADFNWQNVMVDDDGQITGIIDWDNVSVKPSAIGCLLYPRWITADWDPVYYGYANCEDHEEDIEDESRPEQLVQYRQHYSDALSQVGLKDYDPRLSMASHILEAISSGMKDELGRPEIIWKLLDHAFEGNMPFTEMDYANAYEAEDTSEKDDLIREALRKMWLRVCGMADAT